MTGICFGPVIFLTARGVKAAGTFTLWHHACEKGIKDG
jgi:hypothetical protein